MLIANPALAERIDLKALKKRLLQTGQTDLLKQIIQYGTAPTPIR